MGKAIQMSIVTEDKESKAIQMSPKIRKAKQTEASKRWEISIVSSSQLYVGSLEIFKEVYVPNRLLTYKRLNSPAV